MENNTSKRKIHKVVVDRKLCIGAATCVVIAPKVFELDNENIAVANITALETDDNTLLMAAQSCPTAAIILLDETANKYSPKSVKC